MSTRPIFQNLSMMVDRMISLHKETLPVFVVPCHFHPAIEIMYITEGWGTRFVGDHAEPYEEGDICIIGPNLIHEWRNDKSLPSQDPIIQASCYCLFFYKEIFDGQFSRIIGMEKINELLRLSERGIKLVGETRKAVAQMMMEQERMEGVQRVINLLRILDRISLSTEMTPLASIGFTGYSQSDDAERYSRIHRYIVKNIANPIRLNDVAMEAGFAPTAFCRYFKERTQKTFVEYLNDMRIGLAKKMIIAGRYNISTISLEVGFRNQSHFIEQFKKKTGMLPFEYRKLYNKKDDSEQNNDKI